MTAARVILCLACLACADPALALRCGNRLVSEGDPAAKVLRFCGEPASVQQRSILRAGIPFPRTAATEAAAAGDDELLVTTRSYVAVLLEEWTYNFGPNKLMRVVRFENGLVRDITPLGYGYRE